MLIFWGSQKITLTDIFYNGKTVVTGKCRALLLGLLFLAGKKRMAQKEKAPFHQDNVQSHTSTVAVAQLHDFGLLPPPALYSLDLNLPSQS